MNLCKGLPDRIRRNNQGFFPSITKATDFSTKWQLIKINQFAKPVTFMHQFCRIFGYSGQTPYAACT